MNLLLSRPVKAEGVCAPRTRKADDIMKANPKKTLSAVALGMALLATTVPSWAGYVGTHEVFINTNQVGISAGGSMVGARYSADPTQHIGCVIAIGATDPWPSVSCAARNSAGNYVSCWSPDPQRVAAVQGMTASSHIYFDRRLDTTTCTSLTIYNGSDKLK